MFVIAQIDWYKADEKYRITLLVTAIDIYKRVFGQGAIRQQI